MIHFYRESSNFLPVLLQVLGVYIQSVLQCFLCVCVRPAPQTDKHAADSQGSRAHERGAKPPHVPLPPPHAPPWAPATGPHAQCPTQAQRAAAVPGHDAAPATKTGGHTQQTHIHSVCLGFTLQAILLFLTRLLDGQNCSI